jgi:hypothetical protein
MLNSAVLEVAIGVIFVYALFGTICSAVIEGIEAWLKTRAAYLEYGLRELLQDKDGVGLVKQLFQHPLIYGLYTGEYKAPTTQKLGFFTSGKGLPSYIPKKNFAVTLLDIVARGPAVPGGGAAPTGNTINLDSLRANARLPDNAPVARVLLSAIDTAEGDLVKVQANLEAWYDSAMDRVSGWYKRRTQILIFFISLALAIILNIDTLGVANSLYKDTSGREVVAGLAQSAAADPGRDVARIKEQLAAMPIPIGWKDDVLSGPPADHNNPGRWYAERLVFPLPGWILTALAATLGAPFWFDVLNRVMVVRSTVKPHEKSPEEGSEDRQPAPARRHTAAPVAPGTAAAGGDDALDGCDFPFVEITRDEELPPADGGVLR